MPYTLKSLPGQIKSLPKGAQVIWMSAYNSTHKGGGSEADSATIAWGAVKKKYKKDGDKWVLSEADVSLNQQENFVWSAVKKRYGDMTWIKETFDDHVIISIDEKLFRINYKLKDDNEVDLDEKILPVEHKYIEIAEALTVHEYSLAEAKEGKPEGSEWDVVVIASGLSKNRKFYSGPVLSEAVPLFDGIRALARSEEDHLKGTDTAAKNIVGWFTKPKFKNGKIHARFNISEAADWLRVLMLDAWKRGKKDIIGFSIQGLGAWHTQRQNGKFVNVVESIAMLNSVDVVVNPSAGGKILKLAASADTDSKEVEKMKMLEKLFALIESRNPAALEGVDKATVTEERLLEILAEAIQAKDAKALTTEDIKRILAESIQDAPDGDKDGDKDKETPPSVDEAKEILAEARGLIETATKLPGCERELTQLLAEAKLPFQTASRIREQFEGQVFEREALLAAIKKEKGYLASFAEARGQSAISLGLPKMSVGKTGLDQIQLAMDQCFGVALPDDAKDVPKLRGIQEAYIMLSGDTDFSWKFRPENVRVGTIGETFDSTTFSYILGNTMNRRMLKDYAEVEFHEREIISIRPGVHDFKTQEAIKEGYFGDIADVDPETADYVEIASYGDEEVTYAVSGKGNLLTITEKHIRNDDLGRVAKKVGRLGRAMRRTLARYIWAFIIDNATYAVDSKALFHADHGNLGATALSITTLNAACVALSLMTEPGSAEALGWPSQKFNLHIPVQLRAAAIQILNAENLPGGNNNDANPVHHIADIKINPLFVDTNDWALTCPIGDRDIIEMAFMDGNKEPEIYLADQPTVGQMFLADKLQYKIKHQYGGNIVDYRGAYKAVVA
jgi:cation transport regulator ChaB